MEVLPERLLFFFPETVFDDALNKAARVGADRIVFAPGSITFFDQGGSIENAQDRITRVTPGLHAGLAAYARKLSAKPQETSSLEIELGSDGSAFGVRLFDSPAATPADAPQGRVPFYRGEGGSPSVTRPDRAQLFKKIFSLIALTLLVVFGLRYELEKVHQRVDAALPTVAVPPLPTIDLLHAMDRAVAATEALNRREPTLSAEESQTIKHRYLARLRRDHALAVTACQQTRSGKAQAFPAALAKELADEGDAVAARIECVKGGVIEPWKVSFAAPHSASTRLALTPDISGTVWVSRPSAYSDAPEVVDIEMEESATRLLLAIRPNLMFQNGTSLASMNQADLLRRMRSAYGAKLDDVSSALAKNCTAAVAKLSPALLDPLRSDPAVLALSVSCPDRSFELYSSPQLRSSPAGAPPPAAAEGMHPAPDTLLSYSTPSTAGVGYELVLARHVPKGSVKVAMTLADRAYP